MAARVCFAVLAHTSRECLADLVCNLRSFAPASEVVLFNGGSDDRLAAGLDVEVCPLSHPIRWARQVDFMLSTMRWLRRARHDYEFLVGLDSDMLLVQPGMDRFLDRAMARSSYMATNFQEVPPTTDWQLGRRYHYKWRTIWQPLLGTANPFVCFNPGQVFRRDYVERVLAFPRLDALEDRIRRSSLPVLEEMVWPTLAVALGCSPVSNPGSRGIRNLRTHSPQQIAAYRADPDVQMIHPVHMDVAAPERRFVRRLALGQAADLAGFEASYRDYVTRTVGATRQPGFARRHIAPRLKDLYLRLAPE